jgi:hypothetical protein
MARIATRFFGPLLVTNSATTRYTVAAAEKIVIRHVHISNPSATAVTFTLSIGADAAATRLYDAFSIPANSVLDAYWYVPVDAAEIVQTNAGTTNVLTVTCSGDRLVLG